MSWYRYKDKILYKNNEKILIMTPQEAAVILKTKSSIIKTKYPSVNNPCELFDLKNYLKDIKPLNKLDYEYFIRLWSSTYENKQDFDIMFKNFIHNVKTNWRESMGIIQVSYGEGGSGKTSEFNMKKILLGEFAISTLSTISFKNLIENLLVFYDEIQLTKTDIVNFIDSLKRYSDNGIFIIDNEEFMIYTEFSIATNRYSLIEKILKSDINGEIKRRFHLCKRIRSEESDDFGILSHDEEFVKSFAKYILLNEYDSITKNDLYNYNSRKDSPFNKYSIEPFKKFIKNITILDNSEIFEKIINGNHLILYSLKYEIAKERFLKIGTIETFDKIIQTYFKNETKIINRKKVTKYWLEDIYYDLISF